MARCLQERNELWGEAIVVEREDGNQVFLQANATPYFDEQGNLIGATSVLVNITDSRRAEQQLRRRERELADFFDNATMGLHWVGADGTILRANRAELEMLGYSPDEYIGRHIAEVHADQDVIEDILRRLQAGEQLLDYEARLRCKDGSIKHVLISSNVLWEDGCFVHTRCFTRDITEQKRAEQALRESRERLAAEAADLEALRQLSLRVAATADRTAALKDVLDTAIPMVGAAKGNVQLYDPADDTLKIIAHRGFNDEFLEFFKSVPLGYSCCGAAMERRDRVIIENVHADPRFSDLGDIYARHGFLAVQSTPLFTSDGRLLGMFSTHFARPHRPSERDLRLLDQIAQQAGRIIERTSAEEALRASEEQLAAMFAQAGVGVVLIDAGSCVMRRVNPKFREIVGYSEAELLGRSCLEITHEDDKPENERIVGGMLTEGLPTATLEKRYLRKDGPPVWVRINLARLSDDRHGAGRLMAVVEDITERKQAEQDLRQSEEALRDADRRKDEFLATLAHELRNPLAPVRNAVQVLRLKGADQPEVRWCRDVIDRQVEHLTRLIDDLLDISRITRNKLELRRQRVDLAEVIQGAVESSRPNIEQCGHELTVTLPPDPIYLNGDLVRLAQVFLNLLNNAAKYTDRGGRIWLTAELTGRERERPEVVVKVKDTGVGIPAEKVPRLFEMFFQVDRSLEKAQGGLGIGLSLVRRLVELHGGTVHARSEGVGKGCEFIVYLPVLVEKPKPPPQGPTGNGQRKAATSRRILVVDDNRDSADSLATLLRLIGNEVQTAYDGLEGVEAAERFKPEVVLLDIGMPKLNGEDACRRIRKEPWGGNMVLIALTGWGQEEDRRRTGAAGFDAHMVKPVDAGELLNVLDDMRPAPV